MPAATGEIETAQRDGTLVVTASGSWTIKTASAIETAIGRLFPGV